MAPCTKCSYQSLSGAVCLNPVIKTTKNIGEEAICDFHIHKRFQNSHQPHTVKESGTLDQCRGEVAVHLSKSVFSQSYKPSDIRYNNWNPKVAKHFLSNYHEQDMNLEDENIQCLLKSDVVTQKELLCAQIEKLTQLKQCYDTQAANLKSKIKDSREKCEKELTALPTVNGMKNIELDVEWKKRLKTSLSYRKRSGSTDVVSLKRKARRLKNKHGELPVNTMFNNPLCQVTGCEVAAAPCLRSCSKHVFEIYKLSNVQNCYSKCSVNGCDKRVDHHQHFTAPDKPVEQLLCSLHQLPHSRFPLKTTEANKLDFFMKKFKRIKEDKNIENDCKETLTDMVTEVIRLNKSNKKVLTPLSTDEEQGCLHPQAVVVDDNKTLRCYS